MIDTIIRALALPKSAMVGRRVPKNLLVEHGAVTVVDRKAVETGIERIDWIASLKPSTIGVAAYSDDEREASEIAVLTMQLRPNAKGARIATLLHRAIPYPLLLVSEMDSAVTISLAPKRHTLAKGSAQVTEAIITSPSVNTTSDAVRSSFLASLSIANLPPASLWSLYCGLIERIEAYAAARAGADWRMPSNQIQAAMRREALAEHALAVKDLARLRSHASREKVVAQAVALATQVGVAKDRVNRAVSEMNMEE
jgi:Domain of unknown function (DUF4391)